MNYLRRGASLLFLALLLLGFLLCRQSRSFAPLNANDPLAGMGVNIHFTDPRPGEMEMISQAGFRWVRMDLKWSETEKSRGVYDFSAYDRLLSHLDKFHLRALLIFDYTNSLYDENKPTHTDEGRAAFSRWAAAAVRHFKGRGVIWEIWNEPNGAWFWRPKANANDYAKLALSVSKAIHRVAPHEMVVGPALSGYQMDFLEVTAKMGVLAYWSGITIHPYLRSGPETYGQAYDQTRQLIDRYAAPGQRLNVMCGESGYTTTWKGVDEVIQGKYLARLFLFDVLSHVPLTIWYDWRNDGTDPKDPESNFGTVRNEYHSGANPVYDPKPAYLAARTYSQQLSGYRFKERLPVGTSEDYVLSFTQGENVRLVAWTSASFPQEVRIALPDGAYHVTNFDGQTGPTRQAIHGELNMMVDDGPRYLQKQ